MIAQKDALPQDDGAETRPVLSWAFVDKLILNCWGIIRGEFMDTLKDKREELRAGSRPGEYISVPGLPGGDLYLHSYHPKNSFVRPEKYGYYFGNDLFSGAATTSNYLPSTRIRFRNPALYENSLEELDQLAQEIGDCLFTGAPEIQVAEFDYAVDVQDRDFGIPRKEEVQCQRQRRIDERDWGDGKEHSITVGAQSRTYTVYIYDKRAEIEASGKNYILEQYRADGRFREDEPVYRVELRFKREHLRSFKTDEDDVGIETITDLKNSLGDLTRSVVGDPENGKRPAVKVIDPESSERRNRCRETAAWERIAEKFREGQPATGRNVVRTESSPSFDRAVRDAISATTRIAAMQRYDGEQEIRLDEFPQPLRDDIGEYLRHRKKTWDSVVSEKYDDLIRKAEPDDLPPRMISGSEG